jgi:hypothetical protein
VFVSQGHFAKKFKKKIRKFNPRKYKIATLYCKKNYQNFLPWTGFIKVLREKFSKILRTWNLVGRQIVSGPIFSDSPYKNRLVANFSALEDLFWPKFSTFSMRGVKIGQNWRKNLFVPQVPNFIRFAWNSFLRSKTMSAMRFRLIFDIKMFRGTFRLKGVFGHFLTQSQISPI